MSELRVPSIFGSPDSRRELSDSIRASAKDAHCIFVLENSEKREELLNAVDRNFQLRLERFVESSKAFLAILDSLADQGNLISDKVIVGSNECFELYKGAISFFSYRESDLERVFGGRRQRRGLPRRGDLTSLAGVAAYDSTFDFKYLGLSRGRARRALTDLKWNFSRLTDGRSRQFEIGREIILRSLLPKNSALSILQKSNFESTIDNLEEDIARPSEGSAEGRDIVNGLAQFADKLNSIIIYLNRPDVSASVHLQAFRHFQECLMMKGMNIIESENIKKLLTEQISLLVDTDLSNLHHRIKAVLEIDDVSCIYRNNADGRISIDHVLKFIESNPKHFYDVAHKSTSLYADQYRSIFTLTDRFSSDPQTIYVSYSKAAFDSFVADSENSKMMLETSFVAALTSPIASAIANASSIASIASGAAAAVGLPAGTWILLVRLYRRVKRDPIKKVLDINDDEIEFFMERGSEKIDKKTARAFIMMLSNIERTNRLR